MGPNAVETMARHPASRAATLRHVCRLLGVAVVIGVLGAVNLFLAERSIGLIFDGAPAVDWDQYAEAASRLGRGDLYAVTDSYAYRYSPVLAYLFGPLSLLGTAGWRILHVVAALALPTWPIRLVALLSWPFWYDVETGNVLMFIVLAAAWALRGNRAGAGSFLLLALLIPRPLMLPIAALLLWQRPGWRLPFLVAFSVHALAVLASGWGPGWLSTIIAASADVSLPSNVGPSRFIGTLPWIAIGLPLAAWLAWKGRLGLASLAASPYWLPYYLLMLVLELPDRVRWSGRTRSPAADAVGS